MASLIDELIDVLDKEEREYQDLILLSQEKTPVIVRGDLEKLQKITARHLHNLLVLTAPCHLKR